MCERYDEYHIGKRSGGWQFSLRGYRNHSSGITVESWRDWKVLLHTGGSVYDEYGRECGIRGFIEMVESSMTEKLKNSYDYELENLQNGRYFFSHSQLEYAEKDPDGFAIFFGEFS